VTLGTALVPGRPAPARRLRLGAADLQVDGALPLLLTVPAGAPLRFAQPLGAGESGVRLALGGPGEGRGGAPGLALAGAGVGRPGAPYASFACAARPGAWLWRGARVLAAGQCPGGAALWAPGLDLGVGRAELSLAGSGWLRLDGQPASASLLDRLRANPALAAALLVADGVLAAWLALALLNLRRRGRYRVFISYRRGDSAGHAGRLWACLEEYLGHGAVFFDVDDIPPGTPFGQVIVQRIRDAHSVVVVISRHWLAAADEAGRRRLDDPADWVRQEVETALALGKRVIPVLVGGRPCRRPGICRRPSRPWPASMPC
jgi:hypothetical protein